MKKKKAPVLRIISILLQCSFLIAACFMITLTDIFDYNQIVTANMGIDISALLVAVFISLLCLCEPTVYSKSDIFFKVCMNLISINIFFDYVSLCAEGFAKYRHLVYISNGICFLANLSIACGYWFYQKNVLSKKSSKYKLYSKLVLIGAGVDLAFIGSNIIFGHVFSVDSNGIYERSFLYNITLIYPFLVFLSAMISAIRCHLDKKEKATLILYCVIPFVSMIMQSFTYFSIIPVAALLALIIVYGNVYSQRGKKIAQQNAELADRRLEVAISQIQPHFLYNTLNSIYYLCRTDAELAQQTIYDFSKYLRVNMNSLKSKNPVLFDEELNHVKTYLRIEQLRFGDRLEVKYDIKNDDFSLPALTIQPFVENAVKHGVCAKRDGGTVTIKSYYEDEYNVIVIDDNGVGFDVNKKFDSTHIGIKNVEKRLNDLSGGIVTVDSTVGVGTTVTIKIPD